MADEPTTPNPDVSKLKARQRAQRADRRRKPPRADPVVLTAEELSRPPAELASAIGPAVIAGAFAAQSLEGYVVADRDAHQVIPLGDGTTSTTTVLWHAGDRVRKDVHDQHQADQD